MSDEAIFLSTFPRKMDDNALLAHLNDALSTLSVTRIDSLSLEDLRKKMVELEILYRASLNYANRFQRSHRDSLAQIESLKTVVDAKQKGIEDAQEKGVNALALWQERVIAANLKYEKAVQENKDLRDRDAKMRSRLMITDEDEFNWAATVIDNARRNLAVDASLHGEDSLLINDLIREREGFHLFLNLF